MPDLPKNKQHTYAITQRFLECMDMIIGRPEDGRIYKGEFAANVGMAPGNLARLKNARGEQGVTIEALGLACEIYNFSPLYLLTGQGSRFGFRIPKDPVLRIKEAVAELEVDTVKYRLKKS